MSEKAGTPTVVEIVRDDPASLLTVRLLLVAVAIVVVVGAVFVVASIIVRTRTRLRSTADMLCHVKGGAMTREQRQREIREWLARYAEVRARAQPLLELDLERAAEVSRQIEARALRQLRRAGR